MTNVIILLVVMQVLHFICTQKLYVLAGRASWQAAVPFYSAWVLMKIIDRPWWWVILLYIPVVGNVMAAVIWTDTSRAFGYREFTWCALSIVTLGLSLGYISYAGRPVYNAQYRQSRQKLDSSILGALVFATVAASLIKAFTYEAYTIPTSSMEGSMLVGDFLFVNKLAYGNRIAMTPISAPLVHDSLPVLGVRSYVKGISLPYLRLPALREIKRNDIVVFNWPTDSPGEKPIDKKTNYIKRCVGVAGDTIQLIEGELYVNGQPQQWDERSRPQWAYMLTYGKSIYRDLVAEGVELISTPNYDPNTGYETIYALLSEAKIGELAQRYPSIQYKKLTLTATDPTVEESMFPSGRRYNVDNYGPLYIPKKGDVIKLSPENISQYRDIITHYEGNTLTENPDGTFVINGTATDSYTIAQDYYFMMGDNRHNSLDSRYWGYVPHDHIVGTPAMIWLSIAPGDGSTPLMKRIRWERVISFPSGDGPMKSYLIHSIIGGGLIYGLYYIARKKKKKSAAKK